MLKIKKFRSEHPGNPRKALELKAPRMHLATVEPYKAPNPKLKSKALKIHRPISPRDQPKKQPQPNLRNRLDQQLQ